MVTKCKANQALLMQHPELVNSLFNTYMRICGDGPTQVGQPEHTAQWFAALGLLPTGTCKRNITASGHMEAGCGLDASCCWLVCQHHPGHHLH